MNQILVTQRVIVTPEFKRKKKIYKINFIISLVVMFSLCSYYIYAEWDKSQNEKISQQILQGLSNGEKQQEDSSIKVDNNVIIIPLDDTNLAEEDPINLDELLNPTKNAETEYQTIDGESYLTEALLKIPSLDINYPVLSETNEELLKVSLNKFWGPAPNEPGNYCIVGHNYKSGKMFGKLSQIEIGEIVELSDLNNNTVQYKVYDKYVVDPSNVACTSQLTGNRREVTLITCTNYGKERLIVKCREI